MIRLGSLAGYPFEGPRLLGGWTPPPAPPSTRSCTSPSPRRAPAATPSSTSATPTTWPPSASRSSTRGAACWVKRAGSRWKVYICTYEAPGGGPAHREQIARELMAVYQPQCNAERYDPAWKDHWIGDYTAPTTGPVTRRTPNGGPAPPRGQAFP